MDENRAKRVTKALGRQPGLISVKVRGGTGTRTLVFGHPLLAGHARDYPAGPENATAALLQALDLAVREGLALVLEYQPEPPQ